MTAEDRLRALVLDVLDRTNTQQKDIAKALGFTPKHINAVLRGRTRLHVNMAQAMLRVCGYEVVVEVRPCPDPPEFEHDQSRNRPCRNPEPHGPHEWFDDPPIFRLGCPGSSPLVAPPPF